MDQDQCVYSFGDFELDAVHCELRMAGRPVRVQATPLRLLVYLVSSRTRAVPKTELLDALWPKTVVSECALSSALRDVRAAVRDDGAHQKVIRTERGQGYRFVAPVEVTRVAGAPPTAIAVLPFTDMSPDRDLAYLTDGLAEEITHVLSGFAGLQVVARTSAFAFRDSPDNIQNIGEQLHVGTVVEGSVRRAGGRLRITAQVVRVADGYHLWSARYDRDLGDVFALEEEIAAAVSAGLASSSH